MIAASASKAKTSPIHGLHASGKRVPARVRAFVDLAVAHFKALALK